MKKDEAIQVLIEYVRANEAGLYRIAYSYVKDEETALEALRKNNIKLLAAESIYDM